jgi:hypothetical protein
MCDSLKGKLFHATKENTELKRKVAYLTSCLERIVVSEKMIEDDLHQIEESAPNPHTNWVLVLRGVRIRVIRVLPSSFLAPTITNRKQQSNSPKPTTYPIPSHPSTPREM